MRPGDCCDSSCKDGKFLCGFKSFHCLDPSATPGSTDGSCRGFCGEIFGSNTTCSCDAICRQDGTCCSDYEEQCKVAPPKKCQVEFPSWLGDARCHDQGQYNTEVGPFLKATVAL